MRLREKDTPSWYNVWAYALFIGLGLLAVRYVIHAGGPLVSGDMAIYITMANALTSPDLFRHSPAYSDMGRYGLMPYTLIPALARASLSLTGTYVCAVYALSFFNVFSLLAGFYAFCSRYCKTPWTTLLHTLLLLAPVRTGWATFWGLSLSAKPRVTFLGLFIWILFFAFKARHRPKYWPVIMAAHGLLFYVHPISTFGTALGVWGAFLLFLPARWSLKKKGGWMLLCGVCFLISTLPVYISLFRTPPSGISYAIWLESWTLRTGWFSLYYGLGDFVFQFGVRIPIIPIGSILGFWILKNGNGTQVELLKLMTGFALGVLTTMALYLAYHHVFAAMGKIPPQTQLIRAMRFIVFFFLFTVSVGLSRMGFRKRTEAALCLLALLFIGGSGDLPALVKQLGAGGMHHPADTNDPKDYMELVDFAKHTPPHTAFMGNCDLLPLRNLALRPLAYTFKDGCSLILARHPSLPTWLETARQLSQSSPSPEPVPDPEKFGEALNRRISSMTGKIRSVLGMGRRIKAGTIKPPTAEAGQWYEQARRLHADYLVLEKTGDGEAASLPGIPVWENRSFLVLNPL